MYLVLQRFTVIQNSIKVRKYFSWIINDYNFGFRILSIYDKTQYSSNIVTYSVNNVGNVRYYTIRIVNKRILLINYIASVAQSAARQSHNLKAVSSSLTRGIPLFNDFY